MRVFLAASNGIVGAEAAPPPHLVKAQQTKGFSRYLIQHFADKIPITRLTGDRADERFVIDRNLGGKRGLEDKRIALVGLGTIGGHLAKLIAQGGAGFGRGHLWLIDEQIFSPGNVGRHILGVPAIGLFKAPACCDLLKEFYPGISVQAISGDALRHLDQLETRDLVLDATGDQPVSTIINRHFVDLAKTNRPIPERLHVWLEGNGVAARALLVGRESACLDCLIQADGSQRYRVLRPEHPAAITPANCGEGAYFAYGPGPSAIAAGLAVQMALEWSTRSPSARLRTIRIDEAATFHTKDQSPSKLLGCSGCAV
jgi:molybdopterin/thiamine biosynthesis adenylyltransferase